MRTTWTPKLFAALVAGLLLLVAGSAEAQQACVTSVTCVTPAAPICDATSRLCRACHSTDGGVVSECALKSALKPLCATSGSLAGQCVGCLSTKDCGSVGTAPTCNVVTGVCAPCLNDYTPSNPPPLSCGDPTRPACQKPGEPLNGQCTECSATNATRCLTRPDAPVCNVALSACGCTKDVDCGARAGLVCNPLAPPAGQCTAGCRTVGGTDNCPTGKTCSKTDGTIGVCSASPVCTKDADCTQAPNRRCDLTGTPAQCVQCLADGDCTGGQVCDTNRASGGYGRCVPCTPGKQAGCATSPTGSVCLASDVCGCVDDGNCGTTTSGRICSGTTHACTPGCRGSGGNGCVPGQNCSSVDTTPGVCLLPDGGIPDGGGGDGGPAADGGGGPLDGGVDGGGEGGTADGSVDGDVAPPGIVEGGGCACTAASTRSRGAPIDALFGFICGVAFLFSRRRADAQERR